MSDPGSDLALVAAISVVDRLCVDMDHPETGHFDALWQRTDRDLGRSDPRADERLCRNKKAGQRMQPGLPI